MLSLDIGDLVIEASFEEEIDLGTTFDGFVSSLWKGPERNFAQASCPKSLSDRKDYPLTLKLKFRKRSDPLSPGSFLSNTVNIVYSEDGRIMIERADLRGCLDLGALEGEAEISSEDSFESFLRIVYSLVLPNNDGLAIHASSLVRDGKAYVFPGKSGAGKTTIVKLSPEATLLTDEISIIRGIGERPTAYGTPFHGDLGIPGENVKAYIAGLCFPIQDRENYLERLNSRLALEKLLPNVVLFGQDRSSVQKAFHLSYELVTSLPCYDLHFLPEPSFWRCIDAEEGKS
jgi:hypothetical protein